MHLLQGPMWLMDNDERLTVLREGDALRPGHMEYRDGKPIKRGAEQLLVRAAVSPAGQQDLMLVPEGDRQRGVLMAYQPIDPGGPALRAGDKVLREGLCFHVQAADNWGSFVAARLVRIDVGPDEAARFPRISDPGAHPYSGTDAAQI